MASKQETCRARLITFLVNTEVWAHGAATLCKSTLVTDSVPTLKGIHWLKRNQNCLLVLSIIFFFSAFLMYAIIQSGSSQKFLYCLIHAEYMYHTLAAKASGELCLKYIFSFGAFARKPLLERSIFYFQVNMHILLNLKRLFFFIQF